MKFIEILKSEKTDLEVYKCECGFNIGLDAKYLEKNLEENIKINCPSCKKEMTIKHKKATLEEMDLLFSVFNGDTDYFVERENEEQIGMLSRGESQLLRFKILVSDEFDCEYDEIEILSYSEYRSYATINIKTPEGTEYTINLEKTWIY
jgi:hypothetical protein